MMPPLNDISEIKQLLVEGRDCKAFFHPFLEYMGKTGFQIHDFGGISELPGFLEQLVKNTNFRIVESLGIVRDAELDANGAFQSVCSSLRRAGLPAPARPTLVADSKPLVGILILPDDHTSGMLETLLLRALGSDPVLHCIDDFFTCATQHPGSIACPTDKSRTIAYLASRPIVGGPLVGYAARAGYWNFSSSAYDQMKQFIDSL